MQIVIRSFMSALLVIFLTGAASSPSPEWSSERLQRISQYLDSAVEQELMIGGEALIWHRDKVVYQSRHGKRDHRDPASLPNKAIYRIYSMSKPITSVAIMILEERGQLRLSDPLAKHLPEFAHLAVFDPTQSPTETNPLPTTEAERPPTIEDLLAHKAGLTYGVFGYTPVDQAYLKAGLALNANATLEDYTNKLAQLPLLYQPDTTWHYSVATDVLGRVVEVVSGQKFSDFLQQEIFSPLKMVDTSFVIAPENRDRLTTMYSPKGTNEQFEQKGFAAQPTGTGLEPAPAIFEQPYQPGAKFQSGGGGLLSTTPDYLRFTRMLLNEGELDGARILAPSTVRLMHTDFLGAQATNTYVNGGTPREGRGFGLGFGIIKDQGLAATPQGVGSYYWGGAAGTIFWVDPENDVIGIFMTQSIPHRTQLGQDFARMTYQAYLR